MARIRTIKPEFPQSEGIGKLSRDARLLYIQLWTIADDEGRARAASRMLASLLYPYDDDAKGLIEGWLAELEAADKIRRYEVEGSQYLEITKWLEHQKIDKPSKSRLPPFDDNSRIVAKPRETSATDLGPSTLDLGSSSEANASGADAPIDHRKRLFNEGLPALARLTGKGPDACRSFVGKCLKAAGDDAVIVLGLIEDAERNQVIDPSAWIAARLKGPNANGQSGNKIIQAADDLCRTIASFDGPARGSDELRSGAGSTPVRLLSHG